MNFKTHRIAFLNDTFLEGRGADTVIYELAKRLGKTNEVYVIAGETNIPEQNFKFLKIDFPKLFTGKLSDFNYFRNLRKLSSQITDLRKKYGFNKIFVAHGGLSPAFEKNESIVNFIWMGSPPTKNLFRKVIGYYFKRKTKNHNIITFSNFMREDLRKVGSYKTRMILLGVSKDFRPIRTKDEQFMLYVGRLEKHKKVNELIEVSKKINFKLKVIGYGPEKERLEKQVKQIGAPVEFLGRVSREELIKQYQRCSFFVSASHWEGFGLIFIEAGACKKPSIGYNKGSIPEVILNKKTGFVVKNLHEFEEKARILKEDKKMRETMGKAALDYSKKFNWDKIANQYEEILEHE